MRLWTLHPQYLDPRGLVALWRVALLAQQVLLGGRAATGRIRNSPAFAPGRTRLRRLPPI
jgi:hypothetical protein